MKSLNFISRHVKYFDTRDDVDLEILYYSGHFKRRYDEITNRGIFRYRRIAHHYSSRRVTC